MKTYTIFKKMFWRIGILMIVFGGILNLFIGIPGCFFSGMGIVFILLGMIPNNSYLQMKNWKNSFLKQS